MSNLIVQYIALTENTAKKLAYSSFSMSDKGTLLLRSLYFLVAIAYVSFSMHLPVSIITTASYDDSLFLKNAMGIVSGHWMGSFNQMTLIKGPTYSVFLAVNALLGVPVTLTISLLYLLSCCVLVCVLGKLGLNKFLALILFAVLLFQPALFPTRIVRDNIYYSLTLLVVAGILSLKFYQKNAASLVKTVLFGLTFGAFWLTREEGVWVVPGIALFIGYKLISIKRSGVDGQVFIMCLVIYLISASLPFLIISSINYFKYETFEVVDVKGEPFKTALKRLNSVSIGPEIPYLPVPQNKRELIYKISPAFRQLESYFEGTGKGWTQPGCSIYPHTCGDYAGGWFMWALRDAVANKGYYASSLKAGNFYNKISSEIELACQSGAVKCISNPIPFMPIVPFESVKQIPEKLIKAVKLSLYQNHVPLTDGDSWEPLEELNKIRRFLGNPKTTFASSEQKISLLGWYHSPKNSWIYLNCTNDFSKAVIQIERRNSPDIATHFDDKNASAQRFSFNINKLDRCELGTTNQNTPMITVEALLNNKNPTMVLGDGAIYLDEVGVTGNDSVFSWSIIAKAQLTHLYKIISPFVFCIGLSCFVACFFISLARKSRLDELFWIASMLWLLYLSRISLIILVDVSSFAAINYLYLLPAFPVLYSAAFVSYATLLKINCADVNTSNAYT